MFNIQTERYEMNFLNYGRGPLEERDYDFLFFQVTPPFHSSFFFCSIDPGRYSYLNHPMGFPMCELDASESDAKTEFQNLVKKNLLSNHNSVSPSNK